MELGVLVSPTDLSAAITDVARTVEQAGLESLFLAEQAATVDHLSGGRFLFGMAAGWLEEELRNHGVQPQRRWRLMREKVLAMQAIWARDEAEFHGQLVDFDPILSWPKPTQTPRLPVLVGGSGPLSLRAAAEYGDGWMPEVEDLTDFETKLGELRQLCAQAGRPALEVTAFAWEPDERVMARCAELGVSRIAVWAPVQDLDTLSSFLDGYVRLLT